MAAYRLLIKSSAVKEMDAIEPKRDCQRIVARIQSLAADPRPVGREKLVGNAARLRIRQGNYRVVYAVDEKARTIEIVKLGHRRDVYPGAT